MLIFLITEKKMRKSSLYEFFPILMAQAGDETIVNFRKGYSIIFGEI